MTSRNAAHTANRNTIVNSETGRAGVAGMSLMVREALANSRIANRNELCGREAPQVSPGANAADTDDGGQHPDQVKREERERVAMRILQGRKDVVAHIDQN